ncbi:hypothetical protein A2755_02150 [Candidatus Wolfebacteria bacterium RIFCSPHIGHO2_01_FULL_48_22]|uniref:PemK-like protein n=2 Tax=Candidatus Wolfeibacteriota TaxID=1752735 RepID=A0A1F8DS10_9BACT|nr:MAG: hypothetical protein A2755_02150 [Candidatus Wolfebacteria bacterium RIFCSPHIGHO2_01_FULL_48_22]OGM92314.1 MAG: hypothetical protein A2935_00920 [Candidatus Wolfebacteria bacterium RIFCSPLOWO2_01_FULL_47_17b]
MSESAGTNTLGHLTKGNVIFWSGFEFYETGEKKDSLFLILTDVQNNCVLAIRATTKTEYFEKPSKIVKEFLLIQKGEEVVLPRKCVIDLNRIRELSVKKLKESWGKEIKKAGSVSDKTIHAIDKLVNSSKTIRRDWMRWILNSA